MSETEALFSVLRQSADADCAAAIERAVREAPDRDLCRINALDFADQARPRRRAHHRRLPACGPARPVRAVVERAVSRAAAACSTSSTTLKIGQSRGIRLRAVRCRLRADARRNGGGHLHRQPARAPHRGPQSGYASGSRILPPDLLELGRRPAGNFGRQPRRVHDRVRSSCRPARRRCCRCSCPTNSSSCSIR